MALEQAADLSAPPVAKVVALPPAAQTPPDERTVRRMTRTLPDSPPLKTSVTAIAKKLREEKDDWESPADKRKMPEETPALSFPAQQPMTAAERGTVTHRVLGQVDYALIREGKLAAALNRLQNQGVLSPVEQAGLRLDWLNHFFTSPLGQRALNAKTVHREWAFNLKGPQGTLIQGVIDLCFLEDGAWVLADYKTDWADGDELLRRYALQLRWYAKALSDITGIPVRETLIFGLRAGESYPVPEEKA